MPLLIYALRGSNKSTTKRELDKDMWGGGGMAREGKKVKKGGEGRDDST